MSNTRKVTLNLGESLVARIEDIAAARGIAFNDALLRALARGVKSLEMSAPAAPPPDDDPEAREFGYKILDTLGMDAPEMRERLDQFSDQFLGKLRSR